MSTLSKIETSAPGSIMLSGEHAVLHGARAIVCAVDKRIHVSLSAREDDRIRVDSALGQAEGRVDQLPENPALSFVIACIAAWQPLLPSGFELKVEAEFSHTVGLGSSAAVVAATFRALEAFCEQPMSDEQRFLCAFAIVRQVQNGRGSGSDLAASLHGGLIAYRAEPFSLEPLPGLPAVGLWYVGYKMKTPDVLAKVEKDRAQAPALFAQLDTLMTDCCEETIDAIKAEDWPRTGRLLDFYSGLMDTLGVCDARLAELIYSLRGQSQVLGAKISGSGLGDCAVAIASPGAQFDEVQGFQPIPMAASASGTRIDAIV